MKTQFPTHYANYSGPRGLFTDGGRFDGDGAAIASVLGRRMRRGIRLLSVHNAAGVVIWSAS